VDFDSKGKYLSADVGVESKRSRSTTGRQQHGVTVMSLFEIALANQMLARRHRGNPIDPLQRDLPGGRAVVARLAAVLAVFAVSIAILDLAGDGYGQQDLTGSTVAASRQ
jgi:hypothetical protein